MHVVEVIASWRLSPSRFLTNGAFSALRRKRRPFTRELARNYLQMYQLCMNHTLVGSLRSLNSSPKDKAKWSHNMACSEHGIQSFTASSNRNSGKRDMEPMSLSSEMFEKLYVQAIKDADADAADTLLDEARKHSLLTSSMLQRAVATCLQHKLYSGAETLVLVANDIGLKIPPALCEQLLDYLLLSDPKAVCSEVLSHMLMQGRVPSERTLREVGFRICASGQYHTAFELMRQSPQPHPGLAHLFKTPARKRVLLKNRVKLDKQTAEKVLQTILTDLYDKPNGYQMLVDNALKQALTVAVLAEHRDVAAKAINDYLAAGSHSDQHIIDTIGRLAIATIKAKDCAGCTEVFQLLLQRLRTQEAWKEFPKLLVENIKEVWALLHFAMGFVDKGEAGLPANALHPEEAEQMWHEFTSLLQDCPGPMVEAAILQTMQNFTRNYHNPTLASAAMQTLYHLNIPVKEDVYLAAISHCYRALGADVAWQIINNAIEREDEIPGNAWEMALMLFEITNKDEYFRPAMQRILEEQKFINSAACQIMLSHFALRGESIGWTIATRLYRDKKLQVTRSTCIDLMRLIRKSNPTMKYHITSIVGNRKMSEFLRFHSEDELELLAETVISRHGQHLPEKFCALLTELWPRREEKEVRQTLYTLLHSAFSRRGLRDALEDYQFAEVLQDLQTIGSVVAYLFTERDARYRDAFDLLYVMGIIKWENPKLIPSKVSDHL